MKALVLTGLGEMQLQNVPEPKISKDTDVLLKIEKVGICGSDIHYYKTGRIGSQLVEYPYIIGHECAATVKEIGKAVRGLEIGEQVVVDPAASCCQCDQCKAGRENTCRNLRFLGTPGQGDGCLCEYIIMPYRSCFPIKGKITLEQAVLCEPFTIGVYSVQRADLPEKAAIAILGSGPIGLSCAAAAKTAGAASIYMTDRLDYRCRIAKVAYNCWAGNPDKQDIVKKIKGLEPLGVDAAFECAGRQETLDQAVEILKPGGKLVIIGAPQFEKVFFVIDKVRRKEIDIINIRRQNRCTEKAMELIAEKKVDLDFMVTHRFTPEQAKKGFDLAAAYEDGVVKALIEF
jgi:L-iditol 2-dehydrogenase